jgi:hypothetical protein
MDTLYWSDSTDRTTDKPRVSTRQKMPIVRPGNNDQRTSSDQKRLGEDEDEGERSVSDWRRDKI